MAVTLPLVGYTTVTAGFFAGLGATTGCAAMGAVQGGVQQGVGGIQSGVQQGTGLTEQGKGLYGKVTGKDKKTEEELNGEDDDRLKAKEAAINTPLDEKVENKKDKDDWRKFQLLGRPGIATFELFWDEEAANLDIDIYDAFGVNIGKSPPRMEGQSVKRVLVQIKRAGTYYVRVRAPNPTDKSIYTLNVKWDGPPAVAAAPPAATPDKGTTPPVANPANPANPPVPPVPVSPLTDPNKLLGQIISAYRDGPGWVLYIDKGSAQKLHSGQTGAILEGADGDKFIDKGEFTISQVVDANKCIARTSMSKPPGKNKRVLINLR